MTEGNFGGCGKLDTLDWLFFLGSIPFFKLRLVLKLSIYCQLVGLSVGLDQLAALDVKCDDFRHGDSNQKFHLINTGVRTLS